MPTVTPLLRFLRSLEDKKQRQAFAKEVGTTYVYLHQLAAQENPDPRLRFAIAIRDRSRVWAKRLNVQPLALEDLLVGAKPDKD